MLTTITWTVCGQTTYAGSECRWEGYADIHTTEDGGTYFYCDDGHRNPDTC